MDCGQVSRLVTSYAAGELAADKAAEVAAHIDNCPQCAKLLEEYRLIGLVLRSSAGDAPRPDARFFRALGKRLDEVDKRKRVIPTPPIFRWHVVGSVAAAAAAVFVVVTYVLPVLSPAPLGSARNDSARSTGPIIVRVSKSPSVSPYGNPGSYVPNYPTASRSPYRSVTMPTINATDQLYDPYGLRMTMPRFYFPRQSWPIQGTNPSVSQSITRVEYEQLRSDIRQLNSRMDALEQKAKPAN